MVPSSTLAVSTDSECLMWGAFSLSETVHLGWFEFIADYFNGLSLSPRRSYLGSTFMGSTHSGTLPLRWAMIEDSTEEFHTASSGEGGSSLPSPRRRCTGAPFAHVTTTPWMENTPATQAMMMVPTRAAVPR
jgi:hypothetical protein